MAKAFFYLPIKGFIPSKNIVIICPEAGARQERGSSSTRDCAGDFRLISANAG